MTIVLGVVCQCCGWPNGRCERCSRPHSPAIEEGRCESCKDENDAAVKARDAFSAHVDRCPECERHDNGEIAVFCSVAVNLSRDYATARGIVS